MTASNRLQLAPRRTTHHGIVHALGFWFPRDLHATASLQARILTLWTPGTEVLSAPQGFLLLFQPARLVSLDQSPGVPLVRSGHVLASCPLRPSEQRELPADTDIVLVIAGRVHALRKATLTPVQVSDWVDVSIFQLVKMQPLGSPPEPVPALSVAPDTKALFDERLGRTALHHAEQHSTLEALVALRREPSGRAGGTASWLVQLARSSVAWLKDALGSRGGARARRAPPSRQSSARVGLFERAGAALRGWIAQTRLFALLGRKQAAYLHHLLELLARQDDLEVLRHGLPLGGSALDVSAGPALLAPAPRTALTISVTRRTATSSIGLEEQLFSRLRRAYEATFTRLDEAGKHEEAAFLLAELLNESERAVSYLERHGRLKLAAELAEARGLAPGLLVRQWFLAGERQRALTIAVREGAFSDAILRLERGGQQGAAQQLRLLQAERMASAGRLVAAARLIHELEHGRSLAQRWLELARSTGNLRGLALELALDPGRFDAAWTALQPLLQQTGPDAIRLRAELADDFAQLDVTVAKPLAQELTREVLVDAGRLGDVALAATVKRVARWVGGVFNVDQPSIVTFSRRTPAQAERYHFSGAHTGSTPIFDAWRYGRHFLLALGEAGVVLLDERGKRRAYFDVPAHHLVVAPDGARALGVVPSDAALRVARIDLTTQRAEIWAELEANTFADTFDGHTWVVTTSGAAAAAESELRVLDVLGARPTLLRRLPISLDTITSLQLTERECTLIGNNLFATPEQLRFELPAWVLRQRTLIGAAGANVEGPFAGVCAGNAADPTAVFARWLNADTGVLSAPRLLRGEREVPLPELSPGSATLVVNDDKFALALQNACSMRLLIGSFASQAVSIDAEFEGATRLKVRLLPEQALVSDDLGRLVVFDPSSGACLHELRL